MQIIKEVFEYENRTIFILRTRTYAKSLEYIMKLVAEARKDFFISNSDITIVHYAGERYRGTFGIEFSFDESIEVPKCYSKILQMEYTL